VIEVGPFEQYIQADLQRIRESGLFKTERTITSPQGSGVRTSAGEMINLCANNYLGLADDPSIISAAIEGLRKYGFGVAAARLICGTQDIHRRLEAKISEFLGTEDAILYASCFDANCGLFEALLGPQDCIISDESNHASIIDGIRLSKAQKRVYRHADMVDLKAKLTEGYENRFRMIVTDGVFSMKGDLAPLPEICELAKRHEALVVVDDSHAMGVVGATGRGTAEHFGVQNCVDITTGTFAKALGGASGGFTTGRRTIVEMLRQRSRPYLFSNSLAPPVVAGALRALELIAGSSDLLRTLQENASYFRRQIASAGFTIPPGTHPIVPIMLGDEKLTVEMAERLNRRGIFVVGFAYPIVPLGTARIRIQVSAAHTTDQLNLAVQMFAEVGRELGLVH
jgi:glycine C-acetyltransferase